VTKKQPVFSATDSRSHESTVKPREQCRQMRAVRLRNCREFQPQSLIALRMAHNNLSPDLSFLEQEGPRAKPQEGQNRLPSGTLLPQAGRVIAMGVVGLQSQVSAARLEKMAASTVVSKSKIMRDITAYSAGQTSLKQTQEGRSKREGQGYSTKTKRCSGRLRSPSGWARLAASLTF
jgi:hypothetical protein